LQNQQVGSVSLMQPTLLRSGRPRLILVAAIAPRVLRGGAALRG
jgi:hypothetical protein